MLDDINPWGLEGEQGLNALTSTLIGTGVVLLLIVLACGAVLMTVGRNGGLSGSQEKGMRKVAVAAAGLALMTSLAGAMSWGMGLGTDNLMPEEAQGQDIVIEREAPASTCPDTVTLNFDADDAEDNLAILNEIVDEEYWGEHNNNADVTPVSAEWQPVGPDCSSMNHQAEEGTDIEVELDYGPLGGPGTETRTFCAGTPPSERQSGC